LQFASGKKKLVVKMKVSTKVSTPQRTKKELSYELKRSIVKHYHEERQKNKKYSQAMLAGHFETVLGCKLAKSTLSDILKQGDAIEKAPERIQFRNRKAKFPEFEDCLFIYLQQLLDKKISVSDEILLTKAKEFGAYYPEMEEDGFSYSSGWFSGFKERYGVKQYVKHGDSGGVDLEDVARGRAEIKEITRHYSAKDIYNLDETGLFYRLQPNKTLADKSTKGEKDCKDR